MSLFDSKLPTQPEQETTSDSELNDATIEEGDEHRKISGAPQAVCYMLKILRVSGIICVAPAEGKTL